MDVRRTSSLHTVQSSELCTGCVSCVRVICVYGAIFTLCFSCASAGKDCPCHNYNCDTCPSIGSCTRINVALGKTASASSLYNNSQHGASGPACLAVNGNTATTFITATSNNPACVHTADGDVTPHWEVDLGGHFAISSITVYGRKENYESANVSTNVYDSLKASRDDNTSSDYTSPTVRRPEDVKSSPYVNTKKRL